MPPVHHTQVNHAAVEATDQSRCRLVNTQHHVAFGDLNQLTCADALRAQQELALERMADNARELGLDY